MIRSEKEAGLLPHGPAALGRVVPGLLRLRETDKAGQGLFVIPQIEVIQAQAEGQFPAVRVMSESSSRSRRLDSSKARALWFRTPNPR